MRIGRHTPVFVGYVSLWGDYCRTISLDNDVELVVAYRDKDTAVLKYKDLPSIVVTKPDFWLGTADE